MRTMKRTSLLLCLIFLGVFACALPEIPQVDQTANGTAVAQTVVAIIQQTQNAGQGVVDVSSDTPAATYTATETLTATPTLTPTLTPTSTLSPTPTLTWTPLLPMVSVSVPTNCRLGPGKIYDMVGALLVGQFVQVYARDPGSNYWYIRNPDNPSEFCWIWGEYATVTGLNSALPVYTPPPSPTPTKTPTPSPSFELSYYDLDSCSGQWWADILLTNTGTVTFRSVSMTLRDTDTSTVVTGIEDGFVDRTTCTSTSKKNLIPDRTLHVTTPEFNYDPDGHKLKLSLTVCSDTGLNGTCLTDNITFTP
jgi:hypothetical protein